MTTKTIEQTFQKLTQREHILHRSNMYIGDTKRTLEELWVFNHAAQRMVKRMVEYSPGFLKIFDEVLTNALDHSARDETVDKIRVDIDEKSGEITVFNTGKGIPVVMHKDHGMYVPELIFGHLFSSSNYDDTERRTGAGVNGLGVKLANIYSVRFIVETVDAERKLRFVQEFTDNMGKRSEPKVTKCSTKSYTKVTFVPDFKRFEMKKLEADTISLLTKRVYDCIACTDKRVSVFLNGEKLKGKGLVDYAKYFFGDESEVNVTKYYETNETPHTKLVWEYIVVPWDRFEHVSFVNGNSTYGGGKHVDWVAHQITQKLKAALESKKKIKDIKPSFIRERLFLFLRATVVNPQFSSQTKECLTTQVKDFGVRVDVSEKLIDKMYKSEITDFIVEFCRARESAELKSTDGKKKNRIFVPKLEDALWAGTAKSDQCTLILTEGDSAKAFALWGRSVVGVERFGVFPLKGKVLNVRDATSQQLTSNDEINNLKQIIGLKQGVVYRDTSQLRYGKVLMLTDADVDGLHITSLIINLFHAWWPSLIKLNYLQTLKTPIVKAVRGTNVIEFFTEQDYEHWKQQTRNVSGYQIRYFKGLGTSKRDDAQDAFRRFNELKTDLYYKDAKCDEAILLAFDKDKNVKPDKDGGVVVKCSDKRKAWLSQYDRNSYLDMKTRKISFNEFIHKGLIHFSIYDNVRSIPSICDGLKPSQRKILHYMLKKNIVAKEIKVAQLSGYVSAETSYHHGENSLQQAIIGMAQDFVGSNNLNLLRPDSNFGSRFIGGKDAASARYIFTRLAAHTPLIFHPDDAPLLSYLNDDGHPIEPEYFLPIIPMVLVNGCEGIGTGYSTYIPPHNPRDIIANVRRVLEDKDPLPMSPFFRGYGGTVERVDDTTWMCRGRWERVSDTHVKITEIPIGTWVTPYKEFLESLIDGHTSSKVAKTAANAASKKKKDALLKDVRNTTTDENHGIEFIIEYANKSTLDKSVDSGDIWKDLKLTRTFTTNNMYVFDDNSVPAKYNDVNDILLDFYDIRIDFYEKRREHLISTLTRELEVLEAKVRFIREYIEGTLDINRKTRAHIDTLLRDRGYPGMVDRDEGDSVPSFNYLVKMPIVSLTHERIVALETQTESKRFQLQRIQGMTSKDVWREDLDVLERSLPV